MIIYIIIEVTPIEVTPITQSLNYGVLNRVFMVLFSGRWSSTTAARGYLQEGLALLAQSALSPESRVLLSRFQEIFRRHL